MDKLEYIPGDLVMVDNDIVKVMTRSVNYFLKIINNFDVMFHNGNVYKYSPNELKPIPLTPEILEKNGWVKDTHRHCLDEMPAEAYEKKDFPLTHFNVTFGKKRIQASHDCLFVRNLKYVSDLQHLLYGLGINHEMEV